jgi:rare lipoprotein A
MKIFFRAFLLVLLVLVTQVQAQEPVALSMPEIKTFFGTASYYADKFKGRKTANGDSYNPENLTAACNVLPLGTWIKVTNLKNRKTVLVRTNDRLHPKMNRLVDLSKAAAMILGYAKSGLTKVKVEVLGRKIAGE